MMRRTGFAAAALLVAATPVVAQNEIADSNWQSIVACAKEPSDARRHSCIDGVLDRAGVLAAADERNAASAEEQRQAFGLSPAQQQEAERRTAQAQPVPVPRPASAAASAPDSVPGSSPAAPVAVPSPALAVAPPPPPQTEAARTEAARTNRADVDSLVTTVSRAFDPGNKLLVIITAEGQVWQQNESKDIGLPPRPGTAFKVEQGTLGSFTCRIGTARGFRCRRQG